MAARTGIFLLIVIFIDCDILFLYNDAKGLNDELNKLDELDKT